VFSGSPRMSAISRNFNPSYSFKITTVRCSSGSVSSAFRRICSSSRASSVSAGVFGLMVPAADLPVPQFQRRRFSPPGPLQLIQAEIVGHTINPGRKFSAVIQRIHFLIRFDERFLGDLAGIIRIGQKTICKTMDFILPATYQLGKSRLIAFLNPANQGLIVHIFQTSQR